MAKEPKLGLRARFNYKIEMVAGVALILLGIGFIGSARLIPGIVWLYTGLFLVPRTRPLASAGVFSQRNAGFVASMVFFLLFFIAVILSI